MKTYKFEITIEEGYDEFWETLDGKTGCDKILDIVQEIFRNDGSLDPKIKLVEYKDGN